MAAMNGEEMRARLAEGFIQTGILHREDEEGARECADLLLPVVRAIVAEELRAAAADWPPTWAASPSDYLNDRADELEAGS